MNKVLNTTPWALVKYLLIFCFILITQQASAIVKLESAGIIMPRKATRVDFNITNSDAEPVLLVTKLHDLDNSEFSKNIIISPPITRIDPGYTQQISFVIKDGVKITHEILLKASFEGVGLSQNNTTKMPVNQEIGFLIEPPSLVRDKSPWKNLTFTLKDHKLLVSNPSPYVVRMATNVNLLPSNQQVTLSHLYMLPGQKFTFNVKGTPTSAEIIPLSRYGFKLNKTRLPIS